MERIWLESYPEGVPAEIDTSQYSSLVDLLEDSFAKYANDDAYVFMDKRMTYGELDRQSMAMAPPHTSSSGACDRTPCHIRLASRSTDAGRCPRLPAAAR